MKRQKRARIQISVVIVFVLAGTGCSSAVAGDADTGERRQIGAGRPDDFPARYEGELPCADCQGIFYQLELFEDQVFFLRTTKIGFAVGAVSDAIGTWQTASDGGRLTLFGGWESPMSFRFVDRDTLRKLDTEGRDFEETVKYDLRRKNEATPIEPRLTMRGMYRYYADAALFEECVSGRRFQVAQEADNVALERAYLEARGEPGQRLLVDLQGRIAQRPAMEGDALVLSVVPERFIGVWPGETCGSRGAVSELEDTYWRLTRLGDRAVRLLQDEREPHLVLHSESGRVAATGGCNRFSGAYEIDGDQIKFGVMATTMMACPGGDDVDLALLAALEKATRFRKTTHHLELLDADGTTVARFEARYME